MKKQSWVVVGAVLLGIAIVAWVNVSSANRSGGAAVAPSAMTIRVGTNRALGTVVPFVAKMKGFFESRGLHVDVVDFADGSPMEAFASGQLDIALLGIAPSAIWQAQGVALRVVASANGGGHVLFTRNDTGISNIQELRGKKVATPKPGTVTDTLFRTHIAREIGGLDPEKDIRLVPNVAPGDMPTALFVSREVDAAITWEPYASQAEAQFSNLAVLYDSSVEWRKSFPESTHLYPVNVVIASQSFIDAHPDQLRQFLAAYVETIAFINTNAEEANIIIGNELQLDPTTIASARKRIDYTWQVDAGSSLRTLEWSKQAGYLKEIPPEVKLFDLSYLPKQ